jgi:hypothetical protein
MGSAIKHIFGYVIFWITLTCVFAVSCESIMESRRPASKGVVVQSSTGKEMRVLWTVAAYKIGPGGEWGENEARSLLFKPLDIGSSHITFNGQSCRDILFTRRIVDTDTFLTERYQATPQLLGIADKTIQVITTDCQLPGFSEYIRLADRRLIVWIKGVFFFFEPKVNM